MTKKAAEMVTVYPNPDGTFFDGIPAVVHDVPETDAEWMCAHGTFLRDLPAGHVVADDGRVVRAPVAPA